MKKPDPQSFALLLAEADGGTINDEISRRYAELDDKLTDRAYLHDDNFTGELTIKLKLTVEGKSGKKVWKVDAPIKLPAMKMPVARFFTDDQGKTTRKDPRTAGELFEARQRREERGAAKSAAAPERAAE